MRLIFLGPPGLAKPTLARINGICVGGGNELQMACDLTVMVEDAFIRHVGLQHGSGPAAGATPWLPPIGALWASAGTLAGVLTVAIGWSVESDKTRKAAKTKTAP